MFYIFCIGFGIFVPIGWPYQKRGMTFKNRKGPCQEHATRKSEFGAKKNVFLKNSKSTFE